MSAPAPEPLGGDLTQGPLVKTLIAFAMPQMVGNVLQNLNGSINAVWIGQLLGDAALAATANANILLFLLFALVFGFGMAATVRIGQAWGRRDLMAARKTLGTAIGLTGLIALATTLAGIILAPRLLGWLATPGASRDEALAYLQIAMLANPLATVTTMIAMGLRGAGDARTPLRFMVLTSVVDVALNPLLIRGIGPFPALGIAGSAWAMVLANLIGLTALIIYAYARDLPLRLRGAELCWLRPRAEEMGPILSKGLPMGAQMLVISGAGVIMIGLVNREGLVLTAAYGALLQIWNYMGMPAMAIGAAVSAMVAQHIGAGREARVDAISRAGAMGNLAMTGILTIILLLFDRPLLQLFLGANSPSLGAALRAQNLAIWTYLPFGITIVLFGTLRAYGVVWTQIAILLTSMYVVRYGCYFLLHPQLGGDALWYSLLVSSVLSMALTLYAYRHAPWRKAMQQRIAAGSA